MTKPIEITNLHPIQDIKYKMLLFVYLNLFKPLFDFIFAVFFLVILSPFIVILTILLFIANSGKPFFYQLRPGKDEKIFKLIKFKTMNDKKDVNDNFLPDSERLTKVGKFVRKTSLDELPQLFNVITGNMSIVGPRPLLIEYIPLYNHTQRKRHNVKPGITGWAQINGRNAISWQKKFDYDIWYVNNVSFIFDIKILLLTLLKVVKSDGISSQSSVTMEKFTGN